MALRQRHSLSAFLSCLYGSEQLSVMCGKAVSFLSCLYGSEHGAQVICSSLYFLSCLYGSELEYYQPITLFYIKKSPNTLKYPFS